MLHSEKHAKKYKTRSWLTAAAYYRSIYHRGSARSTAGVSATFLSANGSSSSSSSDALSKSAPGDTIGGRGGLLGGTLLMCKPSRSGAFPDCSSLPRWAITTRLCVSLEFPRTVCAGENKTYFGRGAPARQFRRPSRCLHL